MGLINLPKDYSSGTFIPCSGTWVLGALFLTNIFSYTIAGLNPSNMNLKYVVRYYLKLILKTKIIAWIREYRMDGHP